MTEANQQQGGWVWGCLTLLTRTAFRVALAFIIAILVLLQSTPLFDQAIGGNDQLMEMFFSQEVDLLTHFETNVRYSNYFFELDTFGLSDADLVGVNPLEFGQELPLEEARTLAGLLNGHLYYRFSEYGNTNFGEQVTITNGLVVFWKLRDGLGAWFLYLMPAYVLGLPILTIFSLRGARGMTGGVWWLIMLMLMGALVLTAALDYIVFAQVTEDLGIGGLDYLKDFGTGLFGGLVTGTALAFLSAAFSFFGGSNAAS